VPTLTLWDGLRAVRFKLWDQGRERLVTFAEARHRNDVGAGSGGHQAREQIRPHGRGRAEFPAELDAGRIRSGTWFRLWAGSPTERCREPQQALASVPAGVCLPACSGSVFTVRTSRFPPSELIEAVRRPETAGFEAVMS
jgi:hypothetical protein